MLFDAFVAHALFCTLVTLFIMSVIDLLLLIFSVHSLAFATVSSKRDTPSFVFNGDAPYTVAAATLAAALTCPNGNPTSDSPPVLLVHGTGSTGEETWGDGYVPVSDLRYQMIEILRGLLAQTFDQHRFWLLKQDELHGHAVKQSNYSHANNGLKMMLTSGLHQY